MSISWYSISISIQNGPLIFNGYFNVNNANNVQNFYYVNNNQYVDILLRDDLGDSADNKFIDNHFTNGGINILSVIPYINNLNNPYKINLWRYDNNDPNSIYTISYNITSTSETGQWPYYSIAFTCNFTPISGLPSIPRPLFSMGSLFSNNAQVYYKSHSLSTGNSGVRNYRIKKRKT